VVEAEEGGGGTGRLKTLLLIEFGNQKILDDGECRLQTVMRCRGEIALGDRYCGKVLLEGNIIRIGRCVGPMPYQSFPEERVVNVDGL
jgi:hypothetical protein